MIKVDKRHCITWIFDHFPNIISFATFDIEQYYSKTYSPIFTKHSGYVDNIQYTRRLNLGNDRSTELEAGPINPLCAIIEMRNFDRFETEEWYFKNSRSIFMKHSRWTWVHPLYKNLVLIGIIGVDTKTLHYMNLWPFSEHDYVCHFWHQTILLKNLHTDFHKT